jgi:hypothetical protein
MDNLDQWTVSNKRMTVSTSTIVIGVPGLRLLVYEDPTMVDYTTMIVDVVVGTMLVASDCCISKLLGKQSSYGTTLVVVAGDGLCFSCN